jgi:tetratricopeptide (TPR) repeat protein
MGYLPFMETFLYRAPTPQGGILPTAPPVDANSLLAPPASSATEAPEETAESTAEATQEPTRASIAVTPTPQPTATDTPTQTPLPTATYTTEPVPIGGGSETSASVVQSASASIPASHRNYGFVWDRQVWNNCGPATVTTALSFYGWQNDQEYAMSFLRPNRDDKNVSPYELVNFVNEQTGVRALYRMGGDLNTLKALIAAGFPVVIERGMMFEANDWLGHYQSLVAYDDSLRGFYAYDSFLGDGTSGEGIFQPYDEVDADWRHFNRTFIVIYAQENESTVQRILGDLWDESGAAEVAFTTAQEEVRADQTDGFAWHNMGSALVALERYAEAATAFDRARTAGLPWRMLWYQFGTFEAYYEVGRYEEIISLAQSNLQGANELEESYYWRGMAHAALGNTSQALSDLRTALQYNPNFAAAEAALNELNA